MATGDTTQRSARISKVLSTLALAAVLGFLVFPSASEALQQDAQTQSDSCPYGYNEFIAGGPCTNVCDYNEFIAGGPCTNVCDYNEFIAGGWCQIALYTLATKIDVDNNYLENNELEDQQQKQFVALPTGWSVVAGAANGVASDQNDNESDAALASAVPALPSGLAVTGADGRMPMGGVVLLGLGSFAVAVSRRRLPV